MAQVLTSNLVWKELGRELFGVLGMVTSKGESRTVGIVYIVHQKKIFIATSEQSWKARHIRRNPSDSANRQADSSLTLDKNPGIDDHFFWEGSC